MPPLSRLGKQIAEIIATLTSVGARFALIGGLALAPHRVVRATQNIDQLTDAGKAEDIERALAQLGYRCLHRSADAGNYARGDERVDFLYAHRPMALKLLSSARVLETTLGRVPVISLEGLLAFKLQGLANDPRRTQDLEDIRSLIRANRSSLNVAEVRLDPFEALDDLMSVIEVLCPIWPSRPTFARAGPFIL